MNVLITGGTAFIASHLIRRLLKDDYINKIYIVTRRVNDFIDEISVFQKIEIIHLHFNEYCTYFAGFDKHIDVLFHFTWQGIRGAERQNEELQKQNYQYSLEFIKELIQKNSDIMIFLSGSQAEYGNIETDNPISEEMILSAQIDPYGKYKTKLFKGLDKILIEKCKLKLYNCRYISLYGTGDYKNSLVSASMHALSTNSILHLQSECMNLWNYLYVEDAIDALVLMMTKCPDSGIYNFCGDETKHLKEFVEDISVALCSQSKIIYGTVKSTTNLNYTNKKLKLATGWYPKHTFTSGIKDMISKGE
ncbi:NAD-dependent epimerase/dehydratase family protein [Candidatus Stoquefichus massiliensis]|uniref:NAD-dependent epimerase/dehydratase family protein n=1 Tax=Candidatus Stoquefichus massiliensis TaxID=1470350 RepID=UPI00047F2FE3|nr:NAD(P)-dependent oxidoreductase [Candidatus Stoquefichus massiliensis]